MVCALAEASSRVRLLVLVLSQRILAVPTSRTVVSITQRSTPKEGDELLDLRDLVVEVHVGRVVELERLALQEGLDDALEVWLGS